MSTFNSGNCRVPVSAGAREPVYDRLAFEQRDFTLQTCFTYQEPLLRVITHLQAFDRLYSRSKLKPRVSALARRDRNSPNCFSTTSHAY